MTKATQIGEQSQSDKFKQAARDIECDPDEVGWEDDQRKVEKRKLAPGKPE